MRPLVVVLQPVPLRQHLRLDQPLPLPAGVGWWLTQRDDDDPAAVLENRAVSERSASLLWPGTKLLRSRFGAEARLDRLDTYLQHAKAKEEKSHGRRQLGK